MTVLSENQFSLKPRHHQTSFGDCSYYEIKKHHTEPEILELCESIGAKNYDLKEFFDEPNAKIYAKHLLREQKLENVWGYNTDLLANAIFKAAQKVNNSKTYVTACALESIVGNIELAQKLPQEQKDFLRKEIPLKQRLVFSYFENDSFLDFNNLFDNKKYSKSSTIKHFINTFKGKNLNLEEKRKQIEEIILRDKSIRKINDDCFFKGFVRYVRLEEFELFAEKIINDYVQVIEIKEKLENEFVIKNQNQNGVKI